MKQRFSGGGNMPPNNNNNNQKGFSAAARLAKMPMVQSACSQLSLLYTDTKYNHPKLKSVCEALENKATAFGSAACDRVAPVMGKLQPQLSVANDVACKGLDWLETTFPLLHAPTEQVFATAKKKMHEIQDVVGIAASGTMGRVQHTVMWVTEWMQQVDDGTSQSLVKRAIDVANVGLDSVLALLEEVLPSTEVYAELVQAFFSGSRLPDYLFDLGLQHPGFASVSAASGCVCVVLYFTDVRLELPTIGTKSL